MLIKLFPRYTDMLAHENEVRHCESAGPVCAELLMNSSRMKEKKKEMKDLQDNLLFRRTTQWNTALYD